MCVCVCESVHECVCESEGNRVTGSEIVLIAVSTNTYEHHHCVRHTTLFLFRA